MKRLLTLAAFGGVLVTACGGLSNALAATVDGTEITVGEVEELIAAPDDTPITKGQFAQFLGFAIQWQVINDAATADYGIAFTEEEVTEEADRIFDEVSNEGESRGDFLLRSGITEAFLRKYARQSLLDAGIRAILIEGVPEPTPEEMDNARDGALASLTNACVSHILVSTEEEAVDAMGRLAEGEDFGALATELSQDTGSAANNGALPCGAPDGYVAPFRDAVMVATVGEVYPEPVQSQFGYHVILVTERQDPAQADLPSDAQIADDVRGEAVIVELEDWFLGAIGGAEVTVEEEYGVWDPSTPTVVAPVG